jgi:5-methylcytosine-specific restriction endonuclease McrA
MPRRPFPCAICGELINPGSTTLPEGEAVHNRCRVTHGAARYRKNGCRCGICRAAATVESRAFRSRYKERTGKSYVAPSREGGEWYQRAWISKSARLAIYERDGWVCQLCNKPVDPALDGMRDRMAATLDHVECVSWTLVPDHSADNLRLAHRACNSSRRNRELVSA